jgi:His/Glu/Gln/Arg/opine family amino acid ABC transporter permease subunit
MIEFGLIVQNLPEMFAGTLLAMKLLVISLMIGMCIAIPAAILRIQKNPWIWRPVDWYIYFFRATPLLVQLFLVYYGLAQLEFIRESLLWNILRSPTGCAILTFSIHTGAYTANILRGGIEGVPEGDVEAARAIGMSGLTLYKNIILPKAFRLALPAYGNEIIGMLKGTSLASTITIMDLTGVARIMVSRTFAPYEFFITAALIYLVIAFIITRILQVIEYWLNPHMRPIS